MGKNEQDKPGVVHWVAPDGSTWRVGVKWYADGDRAEVETVELQSADWPPRPITAALWRSVPIASLIDEDRKQQAMIPGLETERHLFTQGRKVVGKDGTPLSPADALAEVAAIYREAVQSKEYHRNPTQAVAEALSMSRSAAAKRVRRARDAGLLPETTRGRIAASKEA